MLRRWILFPLKDVKPIQERQEVVDYFFREPETKELLDTQLEQIGDLERIISKVAVGRVSPREVVQLKVALRAIEPIKEACMASEEPIGEIVLSITSNKLVPSSFIVPTSSKLRTVNLSKRTYRSSSIRDKAVIWEICVCWVWSR